MKKKAMTIYASINYDIISTKADHHAARMRAWYSRFFSYAVLVTVITDKRYKYFTRTFNRINNQLNALIHISVYCFRNCVTM